MVDWTRTRAWGEGGYFARIFLNVKDREPQGVVEPQEFEPLRREIVQGLKEISDDRGRPMETLVWTPEELYPVIRGIPSDLIVYFGNLTWRSVGSVGYQAIHTLENDTGPDNCNHDQHGVFVMCDSKHPKERRLEAIDILDVAPTILKQMGVPIPKDMEGRMVV